MDTNLKQCETCPWPIECPPEERPAKPRAACPRETATWERLLDGTGLVPNVTPLDWVIEEEEPVTH